MDYVFPWPCEFKWSLLCHPQEFSTILNHTHCSLHKQTTFTIVSVHKARTHMFIEGLDLEPTYSTNALSFSLSTHITVFKLPKLYTSKENLFELNRIIVLINLRLLVKHSFRLKSRHYHCFDKPVYCSDCQASCINNSSISWNDSFGHY